MHTYTCLDERGSWGTCTERSQEKKAAHQNHWRICLVLNNTAICTRMSLVALFKSATGKTQQQENEGTNKYEVEVSSCNGMLYVTKNGLTTATYIVEEYHEHSIKRKKPATKEYTGCNFIDIKSQGRQNSCVVLEVKAVAISVGSA
jgi:hypothetical protein